jgi:hypothetical protein
MESVPSVTVFLNRLNRRIGLHLVTQFTFANNKKKEFPSAENNLPKLSYSYFQPYKSYINSKASYNNIFMHIYNK